MSDQDKPRQNARRVLAHDLRIVAASMWQGWPVERCQTAADMLEADVSEVEQLRAELNAKATRCSQLEEKLDALIQQLYQFARIK